MFSRIKFKTENTLLQMRAMFLSLDISEADSYGSNGSRAILSLLLLTLCQTLYQKATVKIPVL
jgi:hypothetical protein